MKLSFHKAFPALVIAFFPFSLLAQGVKFGNNKTTISSGALLELESTNKGFLPPRINLSGTTSWSPLSGSGVVGMQVFNTNGAITQGNLSYPVLTGGAGIYYWDGAGWVGVTPLSTVAAKSWSVNGNNGTNSAANFLGTTDNAALKFKVNNAMAGYIDSSATHGNNFLGIHAGSYTTGAANSFFGSNAGLGNVTGSNNTFIGYGADASTGSLVNATAIGYNAKVNTGNTLVLGSSKSFNGGSAVKVGIGVSAPTALLDVRDSSSNGLTTIANFWGLSTNNYLQLNVQNRSASNGASTDIVATADNGGNHYINMGINSSANITDDWGHQNGAYLMAGADTLRIGTQGTAAPLIFNTGGGSRANERMRIDQAGKIGINVTAPSKRLDINASSTGSTINSTYDYLKISNLALDSASLGGTVFNNAHSQYLVIDTLNNLVGVSSATNSSGQILRIGVNNTAYYSKTAGDQYMRFNTANSSGEMGNTGNGTSNYINTISGCTMAESVNLAAGPGTNAGMGDVIWLPAGVYQVAIKILGSYPNGGTSGVGFKFITVSTTPSSGSYATTEYNNFPDLVTSGGASFFVQDLVSSNSNFGLSFNLNYNLGYNTSAPFGSNFTPTGAVTITGGGNAWRSIIQVTRLR
ncbi:beta strand repeat-containing protein [Foetidibacter luteolus]|uniref:beta strand repeat-containing protein n=1 Tax=Foetidibacter luteolus TaxID=2608880 RepID=UPI00129B94D5|nr:hypothetical protein [Foetidibacter luteolus]